MFFTDPRRTPYPERTVARLPRGSAVVFRAFGDPLAPIQGRAIRNAARRAGVVFLVGADPALARALGADGVHLPERLASRAGAVGRLRRRFRLVTAAAHGWPAILRARRAGVQALVVSPVFPSRSPSAGAVLGPLRFAALVRRAVAPVYALGGVSGRTARRLAGSGAVGLAAIEGLL